MLSYTPAYKQAVYSPSRASTARMYFTIDGVTTMHDSTRITSLKIVEELSIVSDTIASNELSVTLDNTDKAFSFLNYTNSDAIIAKRPSLRVEIAIQLNDESFEWKALGTFYLVEWQNDIGSMTVTLIARDNFDRLSEIPYTNFEYRPLYDIAVDILNLSGITSYYIDDSLKVLYGAFSETLDSRKAIQLVALASKCITMQNRYGEIEILPLVKQQVEVLYYTYTGMPGMYVGVTTPLADDSFDIKNISYANTYKEPSIKLEKALYEVIINGVSYKNSSVVSGRSVKVDNELIDILDAVNVAEWLFYESSRTATYETSWRQNPVLECGDVIIIQDSFASKRQTIITRNEFEFNGALFGTTQSKGGI